MGRLYYDKATYWAPAEEDRYGVNTFGAPVLIDCHWENSQTLARAANGEEFTTASVVYVDRDLEIGGYLVKGDSTSSADPFLTGAAEIRGWSSIPDLRHVDTERKALL